MPPPLQQEATQASFAQTWWRRLYWLKNDWTKLRGLDWHGPNIILGHGGIGDELLASCCIRELASERGRALTVVCRHPSLFENDPNVKRTVPFIYGVSEAAKRWGIDVRQPCEWQRDFDTDSQEPPDAHIIAKAALKGGVTKHFPLRPYLQPKEATAPQLEKTGRPLVAIQSSGSAAAYFFKNKEWGASRFQAVADLLKPDFTVLQLGAKEDPEIAGALDFRGKTNLLECAGILRQCELFIGQVGLLMHLNRAVNKRSVIIFGGRESPKQSGYPCNENLYTPLDCAPCWRKSRCHRDRECMSHISPADVLAATHRLLRRQPAELETEWFYQGESTECPTRPDGLSLRDVPPH